jgi:hypothetical protein
MGVVWSCSLASFQGEAMQTSFRATSLFAVLALFVGGNRTGLGPTEAHAATSAGEGSAHGDFGPPQRHADPRRAREFAECAPPIHRKKPARIIVELEVMFALSV